MDSNLKEKASLKGVYRFTKAFLETPEQFALNDLIHERKQAGQDIEQFVRQLNAMCRTEVVEIANIIPTVGRTMIANNLCDASPDNDMLIDYCALGTGTNTPVNGDTTLQTETYRNAVASRTNAQNIGYITGFFSATEVTGTFREAGIFSDATASANSGQLVSRVAINITKSGTETLTLDWTLTIS